jgi:hypothetical protein
MHCARPRQARRLPPPQAGKQDKAAGAAAAVAAPAAPAAPQQPRDVESDVHLRLPAPLPSGPATHMAYLVEQAQPCVLRPYCFFVAWQGVLTLAFRGFPGPLAALKVGSGRMLVATAAGRAPCCAGAAALGATARWPPALGPPPPPPPAPAPTPAPTPPHQRPPPRPAPPRPTTSHPAGRPAQLLLRPLPRGARQPLAQGVAGRAAGRQAAEPGAAGDAEPRVLVRSRRGGGRGGGARA